MSRPSHQAHLFGAGRRPLAKRIAPLVLTLALSLPQVATAKSDNIIPVDNELTLGD